MSAGANVPAEIPEWGPAMSALSDRQRAFVIAIYQMGAKSPSAAAKAAGFYDSGKTGLRVTAHRLMHSPKVQAALLEYGQTVFGLHNPEMVHRLFKLARGAKSENVKLLAIESALNRGGMAPVINVHHEHEHVISYDEKVLELQRLARLNGDDPVAALAGLTPPGPVTDADFEEMP